MKLKAALAVACLAGTPFLAHANDGQPALTNALYGGHAPEAYSFVKVARTRIFLGYDVYGHRIYVYHHVRRVLLGLNRFGRPIYGYIINNRPVFRTLSEYRLIVRPAHVDWDWGGRHWDRRWAGRIDGGEHRGWVEGEHRGRVEGEHRGWERHDRNQMRPDAGAQRRPEENGGRDHRWQPGNAAMDQERHHQDRGAPSSANNGPQANTQASHNNPPAPQGSQQQSRHDWRQRHGSDSNNPPPAGNANTAASAGSQVQGSAGTPPAH